MFNGQLILDGYNNDVDIWYNGAVDSSVARATALMTYFSTSGFAYIKTEVPNINFSNWQRHFIYRQDKSFIALDKIIPQRDGFFDIVCTWQLGKNEIKQEKLSGPLEMGDAFVFGNLLDSDKYPKPINKINNEAFLNTKKNNNFLCMGNYAVDNLLSIDADFACFDNEIIFLANAKEFTLKKSVIFNSDKPVTLLWRLQTNNLLINASQSCTVYLGTIDEVIPFEITEGQHNITENISTPYLLSEIDNVLSELEILVEEKDPNQPSIPEININWQPNWKVTLKNKIAKIAYPPGIQAKNIFVAVNGESSSGLLKISTDGEILKTVDYQSEILSFWPAKNENQANSFGILVGFKDDFLRAFSEDLQELWSFKTEIHPDFKIGDRYYAPWFTDPNPPYFMTGAYSILVDKLRDKNNEEIIIGRPCTIEFHSLDGKELISRIPTEWGNNTSLAAYVRGPDEKKVLLVGKYYTGRPGVSGINDNYEIISNNLFSEIIPDYTNMHAWMERGLSHMVVNDINNNGISEVIICLSGHWNELRIYDGNTEKPLWMKYFGPDKSRADFIRALEIEDINDDNFKEIIVALKNGRIFTFDCQGNLIWQQQYHQGSGINCMKTIDNTANGDIEKGKVEGTIVVGFENGWLSLIDSRGNIVLNGKLDSPVQDILCTDNAIYAGNENGVLGKFSINLPPSAPRKLGVLHIGTKVVDTFY